MWRGILTLALVAALLALPLSASGGVRVMDRKIIYCGSGEDVNGRVEQGREVEVSLTILVPDETEISFFSHLTAPAFYLEDRKVSGNSTAVLLLSPGTHTVRVIGTVPMGADGDELVLLGSYELGKYVTSTISSPYILKTTAHTLLIVSTTLSAALAGLGVFLITRGKLRRTRRMTEKEFVERSRKAMERVRSYFRKTAPYLTALQKKEAHALLKELEGILGWR
ncbi:MAG: hypothetical protein ACXQTD_08280 [Candidatus Syntropharchaeia archaeon]